MRAARTRFVIRISASRRQSPSDRMYTLVYIGIKHMQNKSAIFGQYIYIYMYMHPMQYAKLVQSQNRSAQQCQSS